MDYTRSFRLDGKVALITGGARGLGAETARALAHSGAAVLVTDILDDQGRATVAAIQSLAGEAVYLHHDVTVEVHWQRAVATAIERLGGLDIVVNNAGISATQYLGHYSVEDFRAILDVNVTGTFLGIKHGILAMSPGGTAGHGGSIINLSSVAGLVGVSALAGYCASKGAVAMLTKAAAVECAQLRNGIRVNSIHPGVIRTPMGDALIDNAVKLGMEPDRASSEAHFLAAHPIGHFGQPSDVAHAIVYLASDASRWQTGSEMVIDGAYTAI